MKSLFGILFLVFSTPCIAGTVFGDLINNMAGMGSLGSFYALRESEFAKVRADFDKQKALEQQKIVQESKEVKKQHAIEMVKGFDAKIKLDKSAIDTLKVSLAMFLRDLTSVNVYVKQRKIEEKRMQTTEVGLKEFRSLSAKGSIIVNNPESKAHLQTQCQASDFRACYQLQLLEKGNTLAFAIAPIAQYISDESLIKLHDFLLEAYLFSLDQLPRFQSDYCQELSQRNAYAAMIKSGADENAPINVECLIN